MTAYRSEYLTGPQAIDHIVDVMRCNTLCAWNAFGDAAADGALHVRKLGGVFGLSPEPRNDIDRYEPCDVPIGYWQRSRLLWQRSRLLSGVRVPRRYVRPASISGAARGSGTALAVWRVCPTAASAESRK
jgi:hypothetical protein